MSNVPRFGTDGVRGLANVELTPEVVTALGRAAARTLPGGTFLVGRDTRLSGPQLFGALAAGLCAEGANVVDLGVLPTPAVALASAKDSLPAAMISASHNPFQDNGVKFFASGGRKLDDATERKIDQIYMDLLLQSAAASAANSSRSGADVGWVREDRRDAIEAYCHHLTAAIDHRSLSGLKVVLDLGHGALSAIAGYVVRELGAEVVVLNNEPDGRNINHECGSTHMGSLQAEVVKLGADLGLAFDGDADRCLAVDKEGSIVDGDQIMAMLALDMKQGKRLDKNTVVVTVMTNLGFKLAMAEHNITVAETKVGDRYVLDQLEQGAYSIGGEQSGHVIVTKHAKTGDGLLTGLLVMDLMARSGTTLKALAGVMHRLPQVLRNVKGVDRTRLDDCDVLWREVKRVEDEFAGAGRVLIRPSGTEPLIRVMVEAKTAELANAATDHLCRIVERELALAH
jgi:phosphoglucosamine mutase